MSNVSVQIGAETASLQAQLGLAQAKLRDLQAQFKELAATAVAAGGAIDGGTLKQLEALAGNALRAQAQTAALKNELRDLGATGAGGVSGLASSLQNALAPLDAMKTGVLGLGAALGIGFAVEKVASFAERIISMGAEMGRSSEATGLTVRQLSALKLIADENKVEFSQLETALARFAVNMGKATEQGSQQSFALKALGISIADVRNAHGDLAKMLELVANAQAKFDGGQGKSEAIAALFSLRIKGMTPLLQDLAKGGFGAAEQKASDLGVLFSGQFAKDSEAAERAIADFHAAMDGLVAAGAPVISFFAKLATAMRQTFAGQTGLEKITELQGRIDAIKEKIKETESGSRGFLDRMFDPRPVRVLQEEIDKYQRQIDELIAKRRAALGLDNSGKAATGEHGGTGEGANTGAQVPDLNAIKIAEEASRAQAAAQLEIKTAEVRAEEALAREQFAQGVLNGEQLAARLTQLENEKFAVVAASLAKETALYAANTKEFIAAKAKEQVAEIDHQAALNKIKADAVKESIRLAQEESKERIRLADSTAKAEVQMVKAKLAQHQIDETTATGELQAIENQRFAIVVAEIQKEIAATKEGTKERRQAETDLAQAFADHERTMAEIAAESARQATEAWKSFSSSIENDFASAVGNILRGQETIGQAFYHMAGQMVLSWIEAIAKMLAQWVLFEGAVAAFGRTSPIAQALDPMQSSFAKAVQSMTATWGTGQAAQTAATTSGVAARSASNATQETSLLGSIGRQIGAWLGFETEKTAATVGGEAAQSAAMVAAAFGQIQVDAAVAAAGAMAAISAIPFVGPELAPEVAAETYATTMGFATGLGAGLPGLDVGAWNVPKDMLAYIHQGETVVPEQAAPAVRSFFSGASTSSPGGGGDTHVHLYLSAVDGASARNFLMSNADHVVSAVAAKIRNGAQLPRG